MNALSGLHPNASMLLIPLVVAVAACGGGAGGGVATNPPPGTGGGHARATPATGIGGVRTVITPFSINLRAQPSTASPKLGAAGQRAVLQVLDHTDQNAGWYKVEGQSLTGWVTADPTLTSPHRFQFYSSERFNILYQESWTFTETPNGAVFRSQKGDETVTVTDSPSPPGDPNGYVLASSDSVEVCGITANLHRYDASSAASATSASPASSSPAGNAPSHLVQLAVTVDPTRTLTLDLAYTSAAQLADFDDLYNSMSFVSPQCLRPPATPSSEPVPSPT